MTLIGNQAFLYFFPLPSDSILTTQIVYLVEQTKTSLLPNHIPLFLFRNGDATISVFYWNGNCNIGMWSWKLRWNWTKEYLWISWVPNIVFLALLVKERIIFFLADGINYQAQLSDYVFCQFIFLSCHVEPKMVRRKFQLPVQRNIITTIFSVGDNPPVGIRTSKPTSSL